MNPQDGQGNNNQSPAANAAASEPNVAVSNPLDKLEGAVAAAQAAAAQTPKGQFENQFGLGSATPTVAEPAPPAGGTSVPQPPTDNLAPKQTQPVVETLAQREPEQTPAEKLKQQIADSVDAFLEEVIKERVAA